LVRDLADLYPGSTHVLSVGLEGSLDISIWAHAAAGGFLLVSKDEDFHRLSVLRSFPPKVVWIRLGNSSTAEIERLLRSRYDQLVAFASHEETAFIALG
jgi:predicted nuclease of predicted toxin-antitoxin system